MTLFSKLSIALFATLGLACGGPEAEDDAEGAASITPYCRGVTNINTGITVSERVRIHDKTVLLNGGHWYTVGNWAAAYTPTSPNVMIFGKIYDSDDDEFCEFR